MGSEFKYFNDIYYRQMIMQDFNYAVGVLMGQIPQTNPLEMNNQVARNIWNLANLQNYTTNVISEYSIQNEREFVQIYDVLRQKNQQPITSDYFHNDKLTIQESIENVKNQSKQISNLTRERKMTTLQLSPTDTKIKPPCRFCMKNGDKPSSYLSHSLYNSDGNVVCPVLFKYKCEKCGATGSSAHTLSHCPYVDISTKRNLIECKKLNAVGKSLRPNT